MVYICLLLLSNSSVTSYKLQITSLKFEVVSYYDAMMQTEVSIPLSERDKVILPVLPNESH